jgi:hypothetical protein
VKIVLSLALMSLALPSATGAPQAVQPETVWRDNRGQHVQAHGGGVIKLGATYYWFGQDYGQANDPRRRYVGCYSSPDLAHWTFCNQVVRLEDPAGLGRGWVLERPRVYYNVPTKKYVMYTHIDDARYQTAKVAIFTCATVDGDYKYLKNFRPLDHQSRDIGQFIDDDGTAYLIFEDRPNGFHIARLSDDYLDVEKDMCVIPHHMEGGALFHLKGLYYVIGSNLTGWDPNPNMYATATSLAGPWSIFKNLAFPEVNTFGSQTSTALKVTGSQGSTVIFMGDLWKPRTLWDSRYLWMPLKINHADVSLPPPEPWKLDVATGTAVLGQ